MTPWPLSSVTLRVRDLPLCAAYYDRLGLTRSKESAGQIAYGGADGPPLLHLRSEPDATPRPARTAGLFHFAILVPDAPALGAVIRRLAQLSIPLDGASDHLVSQALYLSDPEGNGIEIYADRPRDQWRREGGTIVMDSLPLDVAGLVAQSGPADQPFPAATRLGHMHLNVADLDRSQSHYEGLGMAVTADWGPFRFMSWDGYHHHLGLNLLQGRGAAPVLEGVAGLAGYDIHRPGVATGPDPDGIPVTEALG